MLHFFPTSSLPGIWIRNVCTYKIKYLPTKYLTSLHSFHQSTKQGHRVTGVPAPGGRRGGPLPPPHGRLPPPRRGRDKARSSAQVPTYLIKYSKVPMY